MNLLTGADRDGFRKRLLDWYASAKRDLPWRRSRDPYAIWISEIMLQQTRVSAVIPYFERFIARFPDLASLAAAPESELLAHWAGLGYYYRARNLQKAAQCIEAGGAFPDSYTAIAELPGVGAYTAAAVASIAFRLPHAVLDGNVYRVLSRLFEDRTNIAGSGARRHFAQLAETMLDHENPGTFNQAMMELGATICLPKRPQCLRCPVRRVCRAQMLGTQNTLPVKVKPRKSLEETRRVLLIRRNGSLLLWQRLAESRLMPGFWELPEPEHLPGAQPAQQIGTFRHGITFHRYIFEIWEAELTAASNDVASFRWVAEAELISMPLSTIARKALKVWKHTVERASAASV